MDLRRVDPSETQAPNRRRSSPTSRPAPLPAEDSLRWVMARLPPGLVREIEAHAKSTGTVYFRFILTVDNPTAERFRRFDGHLSERVLRDAIEKTFHGAARGAQGVFAVHQHGGQDRPAHPHVHALLSPRFENRMAVHISPVRIQRIKERWEREVLHGLARQERRLDRPREALAHTIAPRRRDRKEWGPEHLWPLRTVPRRDGQLELFVTARRSLRVARQNGSIGSACCSVGSRDGGKRIPSERCAALCSVWAMPRPMREVIWLLRGLHRVSGRQR
jgi:hypothetical protein